MYFPIFSIFLILLASLSFITKSYSVQVIEVDISNYEILHPVNNSWSGIGVSYECFVRPPKHVSILECKREFVKLADLFKCWRFFAERLAVSGSRTMSDDCYKDDSVISNDVAFKNSYKCDIRCQVHRVEQEVGWSRGTESVLTWAKKNRPVVDTSFPIDIHTIDNLGPVTDPNHYVYLKGAYPKQLTYSYGIWFLTIETNKENFIKTNCEFSAGDYSYINFKMAGVRAMYIRFDCSVREGAASVVFNGPLGQSSVQISKQESSMGCTTKNSLIKEIWYSSNPVGDFTMFHFCLNGTVLETTVANWQRENCTTAFLNHMYVPCVANTGLCHVKNSIWNKALGTFIIEIETSSSLQISGISDLESKPIMCDGTCYLNLKASKKATIKCPDKDYILEIHSDVSEDCPLLSHWLSSGIAAIMCRMSSRPATLWATLFWLIIGMTICKILFLILNLLLSWFFWIGEKCRRNKFKTDEVCDCCDCPILYITLDELHTTCPNNICAYCRLPQGDTINLMNHCKTCSQRKIRERQASTNANDNKDWDTTFEFKFNNNWMPRLSYVIILIVLILVSIAPTSAEEDIEEIKRENYTWKAIITPTYFEQLQKEIRSCGYQCWRTDDFCMCPARKRLMKRSEAEVRSVLYSNVMMAMKSSFTPAESHKIVDLTFNTFKKVGDKVLVSGQSIVNVPIEIGTGLTWTIKNEDSLEKKTISIGIYDAAQTYSTVFKYWTANRKIKRASEMQCTGICTSSCHCKSSTCYKRLWENDRGWGNNPAWCWTVGGGCTCCSISAAVSDHGKLFGLWDTRYESTEVIVCITYDYPKYTCASVKDGASIAIGSFIFKITKVFGIDSKLPKRIASVNQIENNHIDLDHMFTVILDPEISEPSHATHGEVGDFSFTNISLLKGYEEGTGTNMKWTGVSISRDPHMAHWPECVYSGVVEDLTELEENKLKTQEHLRTNFFDKGIELIADYTQQNLKLAVLPKKGAGVLEVLMKVTNLELVRKEIKPKISMFKIIECKGCRACHKGFFCMIKMSLKTPETFTIHLTTNDKSLVIEQASFVITSTPKLYNVSLFSPVIIKSVTICTEEDTTCHTLDSVTLEPPPILMVAKGTQITDISNTGGSFSIIGNIGNFFKGIVDLFWYFTANWWMLLIIILILIASILLFCTPLGSKLLCCCTCCRRKLRKKREPPVSANYSKTNESVYLNLSEARQRRPIVNNK